MAPTVRSATIMQPLHLVLASASPRRRALLSALRVPFVVMPSAYHEHDDAAMTPARLARRHARGKAADAVARGARGVVVGADTIVAAGQTMFGKPASLAGAYRMLRALQGRTHRVYTAIAVCDTAARRWRSACVCTRVRMRPLSRAEIQRYCTLIDPLDKAGAYAIQDAGSMIIDRIDGCYYNVMGFPIAALDGLLRRLGYSLFAPEGSRPRRPVARRAQR